MLNDKKPLFKTFTPRTDYKTYPYLSSRIYDAVIFRQSVTVGVDKYEGVTKFFLSINGGMGYINGWCVLFRVPSRALWQAQKRVNNQFGETINHWNKKSVLQIGRWHFFSGKPDPVDPNAFDPFEYCDEY